MYRFSCGCTFNQLSNNIKESDGLPPLEIDYYNLPNCQTVWPLLGSGKTKGIFQLEKQLGRHWCKELFPENIHHLAALSAILRPGCISKDVKISLKIWNRKEKNGGKTAKQSIKELYQRYINNKLSFKGSILSVNEDTNKIFENKIKKVFFNGVKDVYKVVLKTSTTRLAGQNKLYTLECTKDHKLLTLNGWKKLDDIQPKERIAVPRLHFAKRPRGIGNKHIDGFKNFKDICFLNYEHKCIFCDWNKGSLDVNHIEGNRYSDNTPENLCFLCPNHHREFTEKTISKEDVFKAREQYKLPNTDDIVWLEFYNKEYLKQEEVYDIEVEGPYHNFIAGNVVVHNCLESLIGDKNITQNFCDNKNGKQEKKPIHPALEHILEDTQQMIIYQESILLIAKEIAGFTGEQADLLRRGIGHKDPKILFEMEKQFIDGCAEVGIIPEDDAKTIFEIIKRSSRYLFNASHSYEYGTIAYWTAYAKSHFPLHFYAAYLAHAKEKQDTQEEIRELIEDAKYNDILVEPPHIYSIKDNPEGNVIIQDQKILFGLIDIKGIGRKQIHKLYDIIIEKESSLGDIKSWSWEDFMFNINSTSTVINNLILIGATPGGKPRKQKSFEFATYQKLTKRELEWVNNNYKQYENLGEVLTKYCSVDKKDGGPSNYKRKDLIENMAKNLVNSPFSTRDDPDWIISNERELIGIPVTYLPTENKMIDTGMTCGDFLAGRQEKKFIFLVEIISYRENTIKTGKNAGMVMAFLELRDTTGTINGIMFNECYKRYQECLFAGNTVVVTGKRSDRDENSLIINTMEQV